MATSKIIRMNKNFIKLALADNVCWLVKKKGKGKAPCILPATWLHSWLFLYTKITFLIPLLLGRALKWVPTIWNQQGPVTHRSDRFTQRFSNVFNHPAKKKTVDEWLLTLKLAGRQQTQMCPRLWFGHTNNDRWLLASEIQKHLKTGLCPFYREHSGQAEQKSNLPGKKDLLKSKGLKHMPLNSSHFCFALTLSGWIFPCEFECFGHVSQ